MRTEGCEAQTLRALASMPFLDRTEMVAVTGWSKAAVHEAVDRLDSGGFCAAVPHATALFPSSTQRFHLTAAGLRRLAEEEEASLDELVRDRPVSAQWRRNLMGRLDSLATVYRLAAAVSGVAYPIRFRWYRASTLDAAVELPGGRTVGIVRQGLTADRTGFSNRMWRLRQGPLPGAVLVLMADDVRLRHVRRTLAGAPVPFYLALEREAVAASPDDPVWSPPAVSASVELRSVLDRIEKGSLLPEEDEPRMVSVPADLSVEGPGWKVPDYLLPATLKPAEKRALDLISDWPWITLTDLAGLMGVSVPRASQLVTPLEGFRLVTRPIAGSGRMALTDRALALLARRDRTSVAVAKKRWSAAPLFPGTPFVWDNVTGARSRQRRQSPLLWAPTTTSAITWPWATSRLLTCSTGGGSRSYNAGRRCRSRRSNGEDAITGPSRSSPATPHNNNLLGSQSDAPIYVKSQPWPGSCVPCRSGWSRPDEQHIV